MSLCRSNKRPLDLASARSRAKQDGGKFYLCSFCFFYHYATHSCGAPILAVRKRKGMSQGRAASNRHRRHE